MKNFENNYEQNFSLNCNDDILQLCKEFFKEKNIKINHLNYIQKNHDGSVFYLCSNHFWLKHYYKNAYSSIGAFEQNKELSNYKYVLWENLEKRDQILIDSKEIINIEHGITVIDHLTNGVGYYNFGTNLHESMIISKYLNHLDDFHHFIHFFKEKAADILKKAAKDRFILPTKPGIVLQRFNDFENPLKMVRDQKRFYLNDHKTLFLTSREMECISWYAKGKTSGDISILLNISKRTVESHIENSRHKLNCTNMFQLGYMIATLKNRNLGFIPQL